MPEIPCDVEKVDINNEKDQPVPSICLTCTKCGHQTESYGQRGRSLRRCLAMMKEECPRDEKNFYTTDTVVDD